MDTKLTPKEMAALGAGLTAAMLQAAEDYLVRITTEEVREHFHQAMEQMGRVTNSPGAIDLMNPDKTVEPSPGLTQ